MKQSAKLLLALGVCVLSFAASAQTLLVGAEATKKLPHKISVGLEAEFRSMEWVDHTERWTVAANADYKPLSFLKVGIQYKFMQVQELGGVTKKLNRYKNYWDTKHRVSVSATGSLKLGKFELSLRERYQYTYRPYHEIPRYNYYWTLDEEENRVIEAKSKHVLRSRLQVEFKPYKKCPWKPYANFELYTLLANIDHTDNVTKGAKFCDKYRVTAGTEFKINKKNCLDVFYRYSYAYDEDDHENGHVIGVVYKFDF